MNGRRNLNRAIEGDTVAIEIIEAPVSESGKPVASKSEDNERAAVPAVPVEIAEVDDEAEVFLNDDKDVNAEDNVGVKYAGKHPIKQTGDDRPKARVVGIIRQAKREFCGSLRPLTDDKCKLLECSRTVAGVIGAVINVLLGAWGSLQVCQWQRSKECSFPTISEYQISSLRY